MCNNQKSHYDLNDKSPAYMSAAYPFKAVGECLDTTRLDDPTYIAMQDALYALQCPNCALVAHVRGTKLKKYFDRFLEVGCPECKLQFNGQPYQFRQGEKQKPLPDNQEQFEGFLVKRVIRVPKEVFSEYAASMFGKSVDDLTMEEGNLIAEKYYSDSQNNRQDENDDIFADKTGTE